MLEEQYYLCSILVVANLVQNYTKSETTHMQPREYYDVCRLHYTEHLQPKSHAWGNITSSICVVIVAIAYVLTFNGC
jgi:hypothetical protein